MNILLIFFALPIAVIIVSVILQKLLKCPILVAGFIFAIFLVVAFVIGDLTYLIVAIAYTILAYITAFLTMLICHILRNINNDNNNDSGNSCRCGRNINRKKRLWLSLPF